MQDRFHASHPARRRLLRQTEGETSSSSSFVSSLDASHSSLSNSASRVHRESDPGRRRGREGDLPSQRHHPSRLVPKTNHNEDDVDVDDVDDNRHGRRGRVMERSERNRDGRRGGTNEESKEESKDEQDRGIRPDEEKERRESEGEGGDGDGDGDGDEEDGWDLVYEAEHGAAAARSIHAFVSVPFRLERFLALGVMSCVQLVCLVAGIVPFRFLVGVITFRWRRHDALICTLVILTLVSLQWISYAQLYHLVRGESALKLYVVYNLLEVGDKLCCAFGSDMIVVLLRSWSKRYSRPAGVKMIARIGTFFGALLYNIAHTLLLLLQVVTINVSLNTQNNALFTLLLSNNFMEIKSVVFKKFDAHNLFQVACSDAVERFQLTVFCIVVFLQNYWASGNLDPVVFFVILVEFFVDWMKHGFLVKFNSIPVTEYGRYSETVAQDLSVDGSLTKFYAVARRFGFVPIPLLCLIMRVFQPRAIHGQWILVLSSFGFCIALYYILRFVLRIWSRSILHNASVSTTHGDGPSTPYAGIHRYDSTRKGVMR